MYSKLVSFQAVTYQGGVKSNPQGKKSYTKRKIIEDQSCKKEIIVVYIQTNSMITILRITLVNRYIYNYI